MKILCLGDSFTEGFLVEESNYTRFLEKAGFDVINLGINGSTTGDMLERLKNFIRHKEKIDWLVVFGGTNDLLNGKSVDFVIKNLKSILNLSPARKNILISPPLIEEDETYYFYTSVNQKMLSLKEQIKNIESPYLIDAETIVGHYLDGIHLASDFHTNLAREIIKQIGE